LDYRQSWRSSKKQNKMDKMKLSLVLLTLSIGVVLFPASQMATRYLIDRYLVPVMTPAPDQAGVSLAMLDQPQLISAYNKIYPGMFVPIYVFRSSGYFNMQLSYIMTVSPSHPQCETFVRFVMALSDRTITETQIFNTTSGFFVQYPNFYQRGTVIEARYDSYCCTPTVHLLTEVMVQYVF
jgi:hypothetical protein